MMKAKLTQFAIASGSKLLGTALVLLLVSCSRDSGISQSLPPTNSTPPATEVLWSGSFQESEWQTDWVLQNRGAWGEENMEAIADPSGRFSKVLRVHYPKDSASPSVSRSDGVPLGGAQFYANLGISPADSLRLSYYVRFSEDFDFVKGGKLPGLFGGTETSGGNVPDGTDGFSTRLMWRRDGDGEMYAYLPTSEEYGTSIGRGNWRFEPGVWYHLEQEVLLNQPGKTDGRIRVWVDDELVLDEQELTFRTTDELQIEGLFFSTFFGGGDSSWATPKDVYIDFAEFEVSRVEAADGGSENEASASDSQDNSDPPISEQSPLTVAIMEKSDWADGFCMDIEVTNWSNVTVEDWQVTFQMNQADVQKTWSGDIERQGALYVATPGDWSREIEPGKTEDIGFCADKLGSDYQPRQVSVSGT
jgi:hypothetical protein